MPLSKSAAFLLPIVRKLRRKSESAISESGPHTSARGLFEARPLLNGFVRRRVAARHTRAGVALRLLTRRNEVYSGEDLSTAAGVVVIGYHYQFHRLYDIVAYD